MVATIFVVLLVLTFFQLASATLDKHWRFFAFKLYDSFIGPPAEAKKYVSWRIGVHKKTVHRWLHDRDWDIIAPLRKRKKKQFPKMNKEHLDYLIAHLERVDARLYLYEMVSLLRKQFNITYKKFQIYEALVEAGMTHKTLTMHARNQDNEARTRFRTLMVDFRADMFVCGDETHLRVKDAQRKYGHAW
jgi:transposase